MSDTLKAVIITVHRSGGSIHVPSFQTLVLRVPAVDGAASGKDLGNCNPEVPKNSFQSFCNTLNVRDDGKTSKRVLVPRSVTKRSNYTKKILKRHKKERKGNELYMSSCSSAGELIGDNVNRN